MRAPPIPARRAGATVTTFSTRAAPAAPVEVTWAAGSRAASQVQVAVDDDVLDYFVLLGSPTDILAGYTALTGRAPVPPDWSFGWWQSRCSYGSAEEALEMVREMREAGFPLDVIHLDTTWTPTGSPSTGAATSSSPPTGSPTRNVSAGRWPPTASTSSAGIPAWCT